MPYYWYWGTNCKSYWITKDAVERLLSLLSTLGFSILFLPLLLFLVMFSWFCHLFSWKSLLFLHLPNIILWRMPFYMPPTEEKNCNKFYHYYHVFAFSITCETHFLCSKIVLNPYSSFFVYVYQVLGVWEKEGKA